MKTQSYLFRFSFRTILFFPLLIPWSTYENKHKFLTNGVKKKIQKMFISKLCNLYVSSTHYWRTSHSETRQNKKDLKIYCRNIFQNKISLWSRSSVGRPMNFFVKEIRTNSSDNFMVSSYFINQVQIIIVKQWLEQFFQFLAGR